MPVTFGGLFDALDGVAAMLTGLCVGHGQANDFLSSVRSFSFPLFDSQQSIAWRKVVKGSSNLIHSVLRLPSCFSHDE